MPASTRVLPTWALLFALLGCLGIAAAWVLAALFTGRQSGWFAVLAALDAAWLLRLGGARPGMARSLAGVVATALTIALANWGIASAQLAGMLGLGFGDTALRMGHQLVLDLSLLANSPADLAWLVAGLVLAAIACA